MDSRLQMMGRWIYMKALHAMSERFWGTPCRRGPWWATLIWGCRNHVPRKWWDG